MNLHVLLLTIHLLRVCALPLGKEIRNNNSKSKLKTPLLRKTFGDILFSAENITGKGNQDEVNKTRWAGLEKENVPILQSQTSFHSKTKPAGRGVKLAHKANSEALAEKQNSPLNFLKIFRKTSDRSGWRFLFGKSVSSTDSLKQLINDGSLRNTSEIVEKESDSTKENQTWSFFDDLLSSTLSEFSTECTGKYNSTPSLKADQHLNQSNKEGNIKSSLSSSPSSVSNKSYVNNNGTSSYETRLSVNNSTWPTLKPGPDGELVYHHRSTEQCSSCLNVVTSTCKLQPTCTQSMSLDKNREDKNKTLLYLKFTTTKSDSSTASPRICFTNRPTIELGSIESSYKPSSNFHLNVETTTLHTNSREPDTIYLGTRTSFFDSAFTTVTTSKCPNSVVDINESTCPYQIYNLKPPVKITNPPLCSCQTLCPTQPSADDNTSTPSLLLLEEQTSATTPDYCYTQFFSLCQPSAGSTCNFHIHPTWPTTSKCSGTTKSNHMLVTFTCSPSPKICQQTPTDLCPPIVENICSTTSQQINIAKTVSAHLSSTCKQNANRKFESASSCPTTVKNICPASVNSISNVDHVSSTTVKNICPATLKNICTTTVKNICLTTARKKCSTTLKNTCAATVINSCPTTEKKSHLIETTAKSISLTTKHICSSTLKNICPTSSQKTHTTIIPTLEPQSSKYLLLLSPTTENNKACVFESPSISKKNEGVTSSSSTERFVTYSAENLDLSTKEWPGRTPSMFIGEANGNTVMSANTVLPSTVDEGALNLSCSQQPASKICDSTVLGSERIAADRMKANDSCSNTVCVTAFELNPAVTSSNESHLVEAKPFRVATFDSENHTKPPITYSLYRKTYQLIKDAVATSASEVSYDKLVQKLKEYLTPPHEDNTNVTFDKVPTSQMVSVTQLNKKQEPSTGNYIAASNSNPPGIKLNCNITGKVMVPTNYSSNSDNKFELNTQLERESCRIKIESSIYPSVK